MWAKLKQNIWQWRVVFITVPNITALVIALRLTGWLQFLELTAWDQFFFFRPLEPVDNRIVIVDIDETEVNRQGQWPMSDAVLAKFLENIKQQQPRVIGLDFIGIYQSILVIKI